jgi:glycosyltransferase involved in cell wall biosynthesis
MDKVSVIIPVYNGAATLPVALQSVFSQDYPNLELIVIDGKSTDGTADILAAFQANHVFTAISEKDQGVYDAMNKGIAMSQGDWLYFLGCDDCFFSDTVISQIFKNDHAANADIIYGNIVLTQSKEVYGGKFNKLTILKRNISHQAIFFRKEIFEQLGKYDLRYPIAADYVLNQKIFANSNLRKKYVNKIIAKFNETGLSGSTGGDKMFKNERVAIARQHFSFPLYLYALLFVPVIQVIEKRILKRVY